MHGTSRLVGSARGFVVSLSGVGLALGLLAFAAALTPSLVPRGSALQGVLAGACFALGYGLGILSRAVWAHLEWRQPSARLRLVTNTVLLALSLGVAVVFLVRSAAWQDAVRAAVGLPPLETAHPFEVCLVATATFVVLLVLARTFLALARRIGAAAGRFVPRRTATYAGFALTAALFWSIGSNVLARSILDLLDSSYRRYDALVEPERTRPEAPEKVGGPGSLVRWGELGRAGREYVASGPSAAEIAAVTGRPAREPLRVYVGLRAAETPQERARLALEELKRVGGFSRGTLIVVTPTGTGWIDPAAMDTAEHLLDGDVASVAVQYSYLSSPLALLTQAEYGAETARALFAEVYEHWGALPRDARPRLVLHGLSLGALNSQRSVHLFEIFADPVQGALWSGPPFESEVWRAVTARRRPDTPQWLPEFRDGSLVRFMNQKGPTVPPGTPWGPLRIVYLQYASDPIVFFSYRDAFRRPDWMRAPRGPDVSPDLRWYPVVTMLQLALDMAIATVPPMGHGHVYAPEHYVDAWLPVLGLENRDAAGLEALKAHLAQRARALTGTDPSEEGAFANRGG